MTLLGLIIALVVVGVALWIVNHLIPWIDPPMKKLLNVVVILVVIVWIAEAFGLFSGGILNAHVGR